MCDHTTVWALVRSGVCCASVTVTSGCEVCRGATVHCLAWHAPDVLLLSGLQTGHLSLRPAAHCGTVVHSCDAQRLCKNKACFTYHMWWPACLHFVKEAATGGPSSQDVACSPAYINSTAYMQLLCASRPVVWPAYKMWPACTQCGCAGSRRQRLLLVT